MADRQSSEYLQSVFHFARMGFFKQHNSLEILDGINIKPAGNLRDWDAEGCDLRDGLCQDLIVAPVYLLEKRRLMLVEPDQVVTPVVGRAEDGAWDVTAKAAECCGKILQRYRRQVGADQDDPLISLRKQGRKNMPHARAEVALALRKNCKPRRRKLTNQASGRGRRVGEMEISLGKRAKMFDLIKQKPARELGGLIRRKQRHQTGFYRAGDRRFGHHHERVSAYRHKIA